ncbi:MAG: NDP-sugar synthase [Dehalococcoidales bacterium]|nr:NDP-sugar synthase [Dehalococcoidales bacterium]
MKAMILAAGEGTRLRPLTLTVPKVLLPVSGVPLIRHILAWLKSHGIREVAINLHYQGQKIRDALGDGRNLGMQIVYSPEDTILGTAGGVKRMAYYLDGPFVVHYGDVLTDFDLTDMLRFHQAKRAAATLSILKVSRPRSAGVIEMDADARVLGFTEKPAERATSSNLENGGTYILERAVLDHIPAEHPSDFGHDVFPALLARDLPVYGYVLKDDDYLVDIGTIEKYRQANEDMDAGRIRVGHEE